MPTVEIAGTILDHRFELEAVAGSGGMAMVYRAHDHVTGRTVALKLLHASGGDIRETQRFEREAQLLAGLHHPAIVRYVAHGHTPSGQPFLAMEWLAGEDLARRLTAGPLGLADSLTLAREVAAAIAVAHRAGVVHRDIKPSNLFLRDGLVERVTVLDFGVAHLAMSPPMTRTGIAIGTPGYMAPEQARGDRELTASADVFSLGAVLFECLTGRPPFVADHLAALLAKILFEEAPLLGSRRPGLPPALERLVARMLAKDPAARPQDAAAVAAELGDLLAEALESTSPEQAPLAEVGRAPTPVDAPAARAPLLAGAEVQYLSVILAVPEGGPTADQETLTAERARARFLELRQELLPQGYRVECLADGSLVATLAQVGHRTATDQAVQATRCALLIKERWPGALVALVTGRGALRGALPVGDALSRAARLISAPAPPGHGGLRLDDVTAGLVESSYAVQQLVTGCYALLAERSALDETRPLLGKPTPCVGREQELALLDLRLAGCIEDGSARAMLVTAPPGTGKSRLRHEFLRRLRVQRPDTRVLVGRGDPMTAAAPYSLLAGALRQLCELPDGLPPAESRAAIERAVARRIDRPEADRVACFIAELCGVPFPAGDHLLRAARQAPELMSAQIQRAFLDLLRAECAAQPVVLVLEDLHWGDRPTVRLCDMALRELCDQPLLILALARPEIRELFPRLWEGRERQELVLGGLRKRACEQLVRGVLGTAVAPALLARVVEQAGGNALFLEELIRALADGKGEALPETVLAILQARFLRLGTGARRVLYAASVFGETFWRGGVEALLGAPDRDRLADELAALVDAELIERRHDGRLAGEHEYAFRHALVRDAAYTLLSDEDRALAHRLAGAWLAVAGERDPLTIAEHFSRGQDSARAGQYYVKAVELARYSGDPATAIAHAERGLGCDIPEADRATLLALIAEEHGWRGDFGRGAYDLLARCVPGSVPWTSVMATAHAAALLGGEPALAERLGDELCAATPEPAALPNMSFLMMTAVVMLVFAGLRARAERIVRRQDALVDPVAEHEPLADAWRCLAHAVFDGHSDAGLGAALIASRRCEAAFAGVHHRRGTLLGKIEAGINLVHLGQHTAAEAILRDTFVAGVELGPYAPFRTAFVIEAMIGRGALAEAAREAQSLLATPGEAHMLTGLGEGLLRRALADALAGLGELARAEHELHAACDLLVTADAERLAALASLAALELRQGRPADARARAEAALAGYAARELPAPRRARARRVLVEALLQLGEVEQAREQLAIARRELHAHTIADPALRDSFLHAVADHARLLALAAEHAVPA